MSGLVGKQRICVIGAGPSGTAVLRAFKSAKEKGAIIPEVVCYEKQSDWGGLWNYSWRTGLDEHGMRVHGSMYRHLWSNGPKECLEFADYYFEEHFGKAIPSFPPREVLYDYIQGRANKANVKQWVQLNTPVQNCTYDDTTSMFTVTAYNTKTKQQSIETFDYVICCTGHFSTPNVPYFDGMYNINMYNYIYKCTIFLELYYSLTKNISYYTLYIGAEQFAGRIMHSHDFRSAEEFKGKNIVVIGTSYSAEDIASQCYKYGVKSVTCSYRTAPMGFHWPDNFKTVPLLSKILPGTKTCVFKDGTVVENIDAIILCTGYQHSFPFIHPTLRLQTKNRLWCDDLHEGIVWPHNPKMMYIGMQDQWFTFNMFDTQAWYARDVILGRIQLPNKADMEQQWAKWRKAEEAIEPTDEANMRFQGDYTRRLMEMTDYPEFDIEGMIQAFLVWEHNKHHDIMSFRDHAHKSLMTGTMAPVHHTPWLKEMDDSIDNYVNGKKNSGNRL